MVESSPLIPAIYVFGDSLVDVGNNNYLNILAKADFPHNGVDFPDQQYTGRFSNGKVVPDFLAEEVGLPLLPPYLSLVDGNGTITNATSFITGVNFASGGSGILNETRLGFNKVQIKNNIEMVEIERDRPMPMSQQIDLYSSVYEYVVEELGSDAAQAHFSKSLLVIVVGSNDLFSYYMTDAHNDTTPQEYVDLMASTFESELKLLYKYGARKFVATAVPLLGCTPSQRMSIPGEECKDEMNYWAGKYNIALRLLLQRLEVDLPGFSYSYADIYAITSDIMQTPSSYGFTEIKAACCGLGPLNALIPCIPLASLCPNRNDHLFWDPFHPTQKVNHIVVDYIFNGSNFTYPINIKELIDKPTKSIGYQYY
ncbi:GDSL esterase/lipase At5g55050-like [Momordica charantia]|uniref:GDSL esterase/lipase At5g55050-like n=1 Tax=Momordica charantia TaxID=3673 RepID=A0A6J1DE87_MOMCH|nr:GDSL esterase/lipase At5g55050-like [Momordica charantia]